MQTLFRVRDAGVTVVIVEHHMGLVMDVSDEIVVLDRGAKIAEGPPRMIQKDPAVIAAYLGEEPRRTMQLLPRHNRRARAAPLLELSGVNAGYGRVEVLHGIDLEVGEGEVVAVIGANGAGKSTLLKAIVGLVAVRAGAIAYGGARVASPRPERLVRDGLALVPEGRLLFGPMSVRENLVSAPTARAASGKAAIAEGLERVHALFPVLGERAGQPAETLSGGEQQMLAVGAGAHVAPASAAARRAVAGARAQGHRRDLRGARRAARPGRHDPARRAGRAPGAQARRPRLRHADGPRCAAKARRPTCSPTRSVRAIYLGAWSGEGEAP